MFRLFRKIRKKLIGNGMFRKYMLYAIGEVLILILGILLALQVNNWNEKRLDKDAEKVILKAIKADLEKDLTGCEYNIDVHESQIKSSDIILDHLENDLPYIDSLSKNFLETCNYTITSISNASFETLKSLGVGLISNVKLRNDIIFMYDTHHYFLGELRKPIPDLVSYTEKHLFVSRFEEAFNYSSESELGEDLEPIVSSEAIEGMIPVNYESLKNDVEYLYFLKTMKNHNEIYLSVLYDFKTRLSELILNLDNEIQKLEK